MPRLRPQLVGNIRGRAGRKLAAVEKRVAEREAHLSGLQAQRTATVERVQELDAQLVRLEGAELAGQSHVHALAEARKLLAEAQQAADAVDDRTLAVAAEAAAVAQAEWQGYIATNREALLAGLNDEARELQTNTGEAAVALLATVDATREFEARAIKFGQAAEGMSGQSVEGMPQQVVDLRRLLQDLLRLGVPAVVPDRFGEATAEKWTAKQLAEAGLVDANAA